MGSCTWFGAVSGDGLPREKDWREGERVCCRAIWRRTGRRKERYNVGAPHMHTDPLCIVALEPLTAWDLNTL